MNRGWLRGGAMRRGVLAVVMSGGCGGGDDVTATSEPTASTGTLTGTVPTTSALSELQVTATLDGVPAAGITVRQGGSATAVLTDAGGQAVVVLDPTIDGETGIIGSHPEARATAAQIEGSQATLALVRFDPADNPDYPFGDPGTPGNALDTDQCGHCHTTILEDWFDSMHRGSASNSRVQDLYAGTSSSFTDAASCVAAGGQWWMGLEPGTGASVTRCYVGDGALPAMNPGCGVTAPCDGVASVTGACADCHAPGIDGALGGHDLLDATGVAYDAGVSCDVCHKVESVDMGAPAGVAGRLKILRPSEPDPSPSFEWTPITFGPWGDVANPRMRSVRREHFEDASLCGGCHQLDQEILVPGAAIDAARWPTGRLPIHSTWAEWDAGPMNPGSPCQSCHMPPDPDVGNGADLYNLVAVEPGLAPGWAREPGAVRRHVWVGPRSPQVQDMLALAATVTLATRFEGPEWVVDATVTNVGPGHALPTGEPSRQLVLAVEAGCGPAPLEVTGGDALPDWAGALDAQDAGGDWTRWPGAQVGDVIRVVSRPGGWVDYTGFGPFGDGTFDAAAKGLPVERVAGPARAVIAVVGDVVTLDGPLPAGDVAYRVPGDLPVDGAPITPSAGAPGFGFARVLVDAGGRRMVPHHAAVDVASDNRLLPGDGWTSTHRFAANGCGVPIAHAVLVYRAFPYAAVVDKSWNVTDRVIAEVWQ